jgi:ribosomal protein S27E
MTSSQEPSTKNDKYGGVSKATYYRNKNKRAFNEIESKGEIAQVACQDCFESYTRCIFMPNSRSVRCASCAAKGITCVNSSWESLDRTRETTKLQIDRDLEELEKITARLAKNRRVLKLAEARAKAKTICLIDELEEEEELERVKNGGMTNGEAREAQAALEAMVGSETTGVFNDDKLQELSVDPMRQGNRSSEAPVWNTWDEHSPERQRLSSSFPAPGAGVRPQLVVADQGDLDGKGEGLSIP